MVQAPQGAKLATTLGSARGLTSCKMIPHGAKGHGPHEVVRQRLPYAITRTLTSPRTPSCRGPRSHAWASTHSAVATVSAGSNLPSSGGQFPPGDGRQGTKG
jgi:hypothetical protein